LTSDKGGDPVTMTGVTHDITDRYRMEEDLRNVSFAAAAASRAKSQFLANMSHELRTPLNAIIGYSELLREEAEDRGETSEMADLDRIGVAGRHLLSLVNEVLDLSKVEAGKTELSVDEFDVRVLIEEIVDTITPLVGARCNRLAVDCPADIGMMRSDPTKLRQVLLNLLSNAAKFTEAGDIRLGASRQGSNLGPGNPGNMVFTVSDTGLGIAPDQIEAAFTAFEQTDSSRNVTQGGTGLGLPLSRHFCAMMGGTIALESEVGKGSTFTVRLPAEIGGEIPSEPRKGDAMA
jgi:signal transduction histidine kinase